MSKQKMIASITKYYNRYVAVEGEVEDWACYVGSRTQDVKTIAAYGDKISEEEAKELFPEFEHLRWRP